MKRKRADANDRQDPNSMAPFRPNVAQILPVDEIPAGIAQDRVHADGVAITDLGRAGHGRTEYAREGRGGYRVARVVVPSQADARGRLIRAHELLHANDSPARRRSDARFSQYVIQCAEDCDIHLNGWARRPMTHLQRDASAVALADIRAVSAAIASGQADDVDGHNRAMLVMVRSLAILRGAYAVRGADRDVLGTAIARAVRRVSTVLGARMVSHCNSEVFSVIEKQNGKAHARACEAIAALMRDEDPDPDTQAETDKGEAVDRNGEPEKDESESDKGEAGEDTKNAPGANPMRIERLPMLDRCDAQTSGKALARSGARLNGSRLALACASGSMSGLFIRTRRTQGGAVLIDGSGSMAFDADTLAALCRSAPSATVGYYAGWCRADDRGHYGALRIFATGGKRSRTAPRTGGSNDVDLYALRWLLRQKGPRIFVTDTQFLGGPAGQADAAHIELERAAKAGAVHVVPDVETAHEAFRAMKNGQPFPKNDTMTRVLRGQGGAW